VLTLSVLLACVSHVAGESPSPLSALYDRIAQDALAGRPLRAVVYIALCDNDSQGIVPVKNRSICNGEAPEQNIYWRTSGGLPVVLKREGYTQAEYATLESGPIAVRARFRKTFTPGAALRERGVRAPFQVEIEGLAYRGREIGTAMRDFVSAVHSDAAAAAPHVVGYIGHDYFLDDYDERVFREARAGYSTLEKGVFALSCLGDRWIRPMIERPNAHVLMLNRQLTYPGAWTVAGILEGLARGQSAAEIHTLASHRYADGMNKPFSVIARSFAFGP
jgi:hypothetical protein